ncbi:MAG: phosphate ABC transporter ATP-binding protein [Rhodospirillales bacterium]|jgi:tungstate transport system ATP-binding protein|nr:phosphate ABC transporter ATP-binding protein [Rhodospirillales bacterium]MBT4040658.1 phosphate ABC transporter ATP-binding protein [Rhodospirillales bacterium]MBT4626200.1 phosphate ABC transporter ATP-binding protein [Rhodospirillales bacterium]MBT5353248.1 phosphate ABC transporter ATP-binding protein [Rhodospirillales bacterium]MBT5519232.1 phosphate ABC transporter ATP-binding protein [Rhodospirillales bacterium]
MILHKTNRPPILPLTLDNVSFEAKGMRLIKDMTCTFEAARRTVIIGPNGAGKSLFLRLCHGLLEPASGTVRWSGPGAKSGNGIKRQQAMVFQRPVMLRRSVADNVGYALKYQTISKEERRDIVQTVLQRTGLQGRAQQPARILSGGEQQRLALARAWAISPEIMFLDEPTANLDPSATHAVEEIIQAIHDSGTRIVMTSHDLGQARRMADDVMFMHRGRMLEHAPADQFFEAPQNDLAQAFIRGELLWWKRGKAKTENSDQRNRNI